MTVCLQTRNLQKQIILFNVKTQVHFVSDYKDAIDDKKTFNYRKVALFSIIGLLFLIIAGGSTYYFINKPNRPMDANELFTFVRPKIVEFLKTKDPKAIQDFKKYANVKDENFVDEIGFCTGFMIEPGIVLTANHCFHGSMLLDSFARHVANGINLFSNFAFIRIYLQMTVCLQTRNLQKQIILFNVKSQDPFRLVNFSIVCL